SVGVDVGRSELVGDGPEGFPMVGSLPVGDGSGGVSVLVVGDGAPMVITLDDEMLVDEMLSVGVEEVVVAGSFVGVGGGCTGSVDVLEEVVVVFSGSSSEDVESVSVGLLGDSS